MALCTVLSALAAEQQPGDFARQWPLALSGAGPWYRLQLPVTAEFSAHQPDLGDLRVLNAAGAAQAYSLHRTSVPPAAKDAETDVKFFPLYDAADGTRRVPDVRVQLAANGSVIDVQPAEELEAGEEALRGWLLDTSAIKAPLINLNFDWTSEREGFQRFTLEASDDLQHWQSWGEGQVGRFSFADERIEQHDVDLAGKPARYLRLLWPQSAPILSSVQITSDLSKAPAESLSWSDPLSGRSDKPNEYIWQLPVPLAVERVKFIVQQPNTLAPVAVYGRSDANGSWQPLQNGLLYRLSQSGQDFVQDQMAMPGQVVRQILLQVDDRGGGLGSTVPRLQVAARPAQVVFKAEGDGPFTLAVGSATVRSAAVPVANGLAVTGEAQIVVAPAPRPVSKPAAPAAKAPAPAPASLAPDWTHLALWLGLLLAAVVLAVLAWGLGRPRSARPR
nr:DUF3999 domain-containing protein [Pseudomonas sp. dw_358]